jgi:hypothetical protein
MVIALAAVFFWQFSKGRERLSGGRAGRAGALGKARGGMRLGPGGPDDDLEFLRSSVERLSSRGMEGVGGSGRGMPSGGYKRSASGSYVRPHPSAGDDLDEGAWD